MGYGLQPNRSKGIENSKHVDNLEKLNIREHVKKKQNSPDVDQDSWTINYNLEMIWK